MANGQAKCCDSLILYEMFRQLLLAIDVFVRNANVKMISICIPYTHENEFTDDMFSELIDGHVNSEDSKPNLTILFAPPFVDPSSKRSQVSRPLIPK